MDEKVVGSLSNATADVVAVQLSPEIYVFGVHLHLHTLVIGGLLGALVLAFIFLFLVPGILQSAKLRRLVQKLEKDGVRELDALAELFSVDKILSHLWAEFRDTLHEQKDLDARGTYQVTAVRQTVPAETYFSEQMLVHSPLRTEFFKHLPGILTGIGIIGTFSGLIIGLQSFGDVSDDPAKVRQSLSLLLSGVHSAFYISASAIALAMLITALEKWVVTNLFKKVERLCLALDSLFSAGAGEEYLSRLVQASESSAKEAKQLKQSLVNDLKQILESVAERQIQAQTMSTAGIAKEIVSGLKESLEQPLAQIGSAVQQVSGNQGDAVHKLLTDTMAAMTAQIRDLFAGQVDGIRGLQQQTIDSLSSAVGQLQQLVGDVSTRGKETTDAMSAQLASAIASMEERQRSMNEQTQALVDTMKGQVSQANKEASDRMQAAVGRLGEAVTQITDTLMSSIQSNSDREDERAKKLTDHTTAISTNAQALTNELLKQTSEAVTAMKQAVESMRTGTSETVNRMNLGAADMLRAATEMGRAGTATGSALERAQGLVDQLSNASSLLTNSTGVLNKAIDDYKATRETLALMVQQLQATVESAKKEATLTADVLSRIEGAANTLKEAQNQAEKYLTGVTEVLAGAHQQFGSQVISTLNSVNGEFHRHVERGTKALAGAIDELDQVLDRVGGR